MEKFKVTYLNWYELGGAYLLSSTYDLDKKLFDVIGNHIFKPTDVWWYGINGNYDEYDIWLSKNFFPKALDKRI